MEDSTVIEDASEEQSVAECAAPAEPSSINELHESTTLVQQSTETSEGPNLEVLWSTLLEPESDDEFERLKSATDLKRKTSKSSKSTKSSKSSISSPIFTEGSECDDGILLDNSYSNPSHEVLISLESSSDSKMTEAFINQMDINSTFQLCSSEELNSELGSGITYNSQMTSIASEEKLPFDETYSLLPKIDMSDDIHYEGDQPERPVVDDQLLVLFLEGKKWDLKVYVGEYKFYCFLDVLKVYSPYFQRPKMANICVVRLPSHKVTAQAFNIIYNWMLFDDPPVRKRYSNRCLLEVYSSAKYLGIKGIVEAVWDTLDIIKNENEAFALMPDMNYMDLTTFEFLCFARISRFFLTLVASHEWIEMDFTYVSRLLASHNVGVNSEIEIFYSAVRWVSYDWPERVDYLPELMKCVRFGLLSPIFLRFLQKKPSTRIMRYITKSPAVQEQINKAFVYATAELFCKDPQQGLPFPLPEYDVPEQRRWLYDENCSYHHDLKCSQRQFITYKQFLTYLESLHETGPEYWRNLVYIVEPVNCCKRLSPE